MRTVRWFGILALIVAVGVITAKQVMRPEVRQTPVPLVPDPTATRTAFAGTQDATDRELAEFFQQLARAANRRDGSAGANLFDPDRLHREAFSPATRTGSESPPQDPRGPVAALEGVWDGFAAGWLGGWTETRLRRIDPLPGGAEVVVYAAHRTAHDVIPARWWLIRRGGTWRAYDVEDVRVGLRLSHQVAAMSPTRLDDQRRPAIEAANRAVAAAATALADGDTATADAALAPARTVPLPRPQRVVLCLTEAAVALGRNDPADALKWADQTDQAHAGLPGTDLVRAVAYFRLRKWHEAEGAARKFVELFGPDARASLVLGLSLLERGERDEAASVLRSAATENPGRLDLADALRRAAPPPGSRITPDDS